MPGLSKLKCSHSPRQSNIYSTKTILSESKSNIYNIYITKTDNFVRRTLPSSRESSASKVWLPSYKAKTDDSDSKTNDSDSKTDNFAQRTLPSTRGWSASKVWSPSSIANAKV